MLGRAEEPNTLFLPVLFGQVWKIGMKKAAHLSARPLHQDSNLRMADSESAALTGLGDTPALGAVGETRTLMTLATATSRLRVYQFRHDRISDF